MRWVIIILALFFGFARSGWAQEHAPAATPPNEGALAKPPAAGIDRPAVFVPASVDYANVRVLLRGVKEEPKQAELEMGPLVNSQYPSLQIQPIVNLVSAQAIGSDWEVELKIQDLVPFGESSTPLFYQGRQVEVLRFSKTGLIVRPAVEGSYVARQGEKFLLVLENPSTIEYQHVRARLRFEDIDVCSFAVERFSGSAPEPGKHSDCSAFNNWTDFGVPRYAQVSLRADPDAQWFNDPQTGSARSGTRKGWLTLRFQEAAGPIHEQNLPLVIDFQPGAWNIFSTLAKVFLFLALGALLSLALRVSVPNFRRKRQLKDRVTEARKRTRAISGEVDSMLRVLLRVERVTLDQLRRTEWAIWPSYADLAQRVEQGLTVLERRIGMVQRLDIALGRRSLLLDQGVAPTRFQQIEAELTNACEALKGEQLTEADWLFTQQTLEAAEKLLREPTKEEKDAFEAALVQRWKSLLDHFKRDNNGALTVPASLKEMEACFPPIGALPTTDDDGSQWVTSIGAVRADLQLTALELLREFEFFTRTDLDKKWDDAKEALKRLLATPAVENLQEARSWLRQMAEGISEGDILRALEQGAASIEKDPQTAALNEKVRWQVRLRQGALNTAAARERITCEWRFEDLVSPKARRPRKPKPAPSPVSPGSNSKDSSEANPPAATLALVERGWQAWHYFEPGVAESSISATFSNSKGEPLTLENKSWSQQKITPENGERKKHESRDRLSRTGLEAVQLIAALLVPLATLALTTAGGGGSSQWWDLVAIGFGSDTIKNILVGRQDQPQSGAVSS